MLVLAGQVGDAHIWNHSSLKSQIDNGSWLALPPHIRNVVTMDGTVKKPYFCADSAFALVPFCNEVL
jgi:hypothetical protein